MSWFTKRIQPLQHRDRLLFQYTGRDDLMRGSKDNLSADALDKRIRVLLKVPRDLRIHVCNIDIHTNGSGTALEALEEKDLGTLTWVPHAGNTDPVVASDAEAPEAPAPSKRERGASSGSGPAAKRACEQKFRKQAPKNPKKKAKPSSASMLVTPQVEAPPKPSSSTAANTKDVINLDDLPEDPTAESGQGGSGKVESGKDASSSHPLPEQPDITSAEATAHDAEQKLPLSGATEHSETARRSARPCAGAEDEIEGLRQSYTDSQKVVSILETCVKNYEEEIAKRPSIDALSAQVKVLEAENESLKKFLKESSEEETKKKKELEEKHAQGMADLDDKLKKSQLRVKTLAGKNKAYETEAEDIDKLIFCKDFLFDSDFLIFCFDRGRN
ncbi:hypothetical protein QYE76_041944 [Lolium multiflorum]|uniref:Uncharacterized protein n=1 Tax=Lolium multiflorum TaxID=4521 RepID=A0AAD8TER6_LOLMU|nr:hypothetical protein QYE76_041944 [Lolium multiflorum]